MKVMQYKELYRNSEILSRNYNNVSVVSVTYFHFNGRETAEYVIKCTWTAYSLILPFRMMFATMWKCSWVRFPCSCGGDSLVGMKKCIFSCFDWWIGDSWVYPASHPMTAMTLNWPKFSFQLNFFLPCPHSYSGHFLLCFFSVFHYFTLFYFVPHPMHLLHISPPFFPHLLSQIMAERKSAKAAAGSSSQNGSDVPLQGTHTHSHTHTHIHAQSHIRHLRGHYNDI